MDIYPISLALSKILPALPQFLNNKKPDLVALQHTSPQLSISSTARKWQITAETAVVKEKYCL
jgi:hypothetical protein